MSEISPAADTFQTLVERHSGPVVILNLLKFKADAGDGRTGAQAYAVYGAAASEIVRALGGELVWSGRPQAVLAGDAAGDWDAVALMRYPSAQALAGMSASPEYQAILHHRAAGLERTTVIACSEDFTLEE
jgi:uncharacterized protein (DUF1330 family)